MATCTDFVKDEAGNIVEIHCTYDPETKGGNAIDRKVKGTIHWVSAKHAVESEVRLYDRLFSTENPSKVEDGQDFTANLNPDSLEVIESAMVEPSLADVTVGDRFQFMRNGYFVKDIDSTEEKPVFNRIISLRDTWSKMQKLQKKK